MVHPLYKTSVYIYILDLIFSSTPDQISDVSISSAFFHTDHVLLEFIVFTKIQRLRPPARFVYNFKNANFNEIRAELSLTDFSSAYNAPNVDSSWNNFTDIFRSIINKHISKIKIKYCTAPAWIDSEIRHLRNKKRECWEESKKKKEKKKERKEGRNLLRPGSRSTCCEIV